MAQTGRPPIDRSKLDQLRACYASGDGPSAAARKCGVHRNTASTYFAQFSGEANHDDLIAAATRAIVEAYVRGYAVGWNAKRAAIAHATR